MARSPIKGAIDEPLVTNPLDERYSSPLRADPRPMDGVYHAAYVLARMHYASSRLHSSGILDQDDSAIVASRIKGYGSLAADGLATIRRHGRLTDMGEAILRGAEDYMAEVMVPAS